MGHCSRLSWLGQNVCPCAYHRCRHTRNGSCLLRGVLVVLGLPGEGGGWDTIEGPTEGRFSTIFGNREVIFAQNTGGVRPRGEAFSNVVEGRKW